MTELCTVYRLDIRDPGQALKATYEGAPLVVHIADRPGIRVDRSAPPHPPDWADDVSRMTGAPFEYETQSAGCLIIVDTGDAWYAVCFGTGRHWLDENAIVRDFGIAVAIRCLDAERVAEVSRTALNLTGRHDHTSIPSGGHVRTFAIEQYAEIVKVIGGRSKTLDVAHLRGRGRVAGVPLEGRDGLRVRLAASPEGLIDDLLAIDEAYQRAPHPDLAFIEGLRPIGPNDSRYARARAALATELLKPASSRVGLAVPSDIDSVAIDRFIVEASGRLRGSPEPDFETIRDTLSLAPTSARLDAFDKGLVRLKIAGERDLRTSRLASWMTADLKVGTDQFVLHDGAIYALTGQYAKAVDTSVRELLRRGSQTTLPAWRPGEHEGDYNERVARGAGFELLDKNLVRGGAHPKGIEICDLLGPRGELICVKHATKSSVLSHLFFQAIVAAEALADGEEARTKLLAKLPAGRKRDLPARPEFVFGIHLGRPLTVASLFTFAKVALTTAARRLDRLNMKVSVVAIGSAEAGDAAKRQLRRPSGRAMSNAGRRPAGGEPGNPSRQPRREFVRQ